VKRWLKPIHGCRNVRAMGFFSGSDGEHFFEKRKSCESVYWKGNLKAAEIGRDKRKDFRETPMKALFDGLTRR
jgi:hypothetical protein